MPCLLEKFSKYLGTFLVNSEEKNQVHSLQIPFTHSDRSDQDTDKSTENCHHCPPGDRKKETPKVSYCLEVSELTNIILATDINSQTPA